MAPEADEDEAKFSALRAKSEALQRQRAVLEEQEAALQRELAFAEAWAPTSQERRASPPRADQAEQVASTEAGEEARAEPATPGFIADRFMQGLAWLPSRVRTPFGCEEVVSKYARLPVTLYCGFDVASRAVEETLQRLFEGSCRVRFRVRHFSTLEECSMEAVLAEQVTLLCFHCPGKEGEADTIYGRSLRKNLHYAGKGWASRDGSVPGASACFGWGFKDPYVMLYRNSRGDSGLVAEALEALGSTQLLKHLFEDEDVKGGIEDAARQWAFHLAAKVEDWSRGCWEPEAEVLRGPEWTFEEIMRWDFIVNRRGMQDG